MNARPLLAGLWTEACLPADALDDVFLTGREPVLPSSLAVGTAADRMEESESDFGRPRAINHAARMGITPPHWDWPCVPLGTHKAVWPSA